jgi:hypothetical protein
MMLYLLVGASVLVSSAAAQYSRESLQQAADQYVASVAAGKFSVPEAAKFVNTENLKDADLLAGFYSELVKVGGAAPPPGLEDAAKEFRGRRGFGGQDDE